MNDSRNLGSYKDQESKMSRSKRNYQEMEDTLRVTGKSAVKERKEELTNRFTTSFAATEPYISFYSKSGDTDARLLSNFSTHRIDLDFGAIHPAAVGDVAVYPTGEHAFQGAKFRFLIHTCLTEARKQELHHYSCLFEGTALSSCHLRTAAAAKKAGGRNGLSLSVEELAQWEQVTMVVQEQICRCKLQDNGIRAYLISTGLSYLVHNERAVGWPRYGATVLQAANSPFKDGRRWMKGDNYLGLMWMKLREEIAAEMK